MPYETMQKRVDSHSCGVCQGNLTIAWGGAYGFNGYILRCGNDINHDILTDYKRPSPEYEEGNKLFRRLYGMDSTALMNMNSRLFVMSKTRLIACWLIMLIVLLSMASIL